MLRAVDILVPGISTLTRYVRYYALYAALAAYTREHGLDSAACRRLLRRSEVILAAAALVDSDPAAGPVPAHGVDRVRQSYDGSELDVAAVTGTDDSLSRSYSPRAWGFWSQYGGPSTTLGTVVVEDGALCPGRHPCPEPVRELFAPLFGATSHDRLSRQRLEALRPVTPQAGDAPEVPWLRGLFTATSDGRHAPDAWEPDDRRRRAAFRMLGRATALYGTETDQSWEEIVRSAVVFGDRVETDPVLSGIHGVSGWRGVLLRHYSVGAWRRLWAGLVASIGAEGDDADSSQEELREWLADEMPDEPVRAFMDKLPPTTADGHPAPAEREVLAEGDPRDPPTNVALLLLGGRRTNELEGEVRTAFLGTQHDILNPRWVSLRTDDLRDRSMRDLAVRLVDDMLAQSQRVALAKMRLGGDGRLMVFSRVHQRGGRFYKTSDEGDTDIGLRIDQLVEIAVQLGLIDRADDLSASVAPLGSALLEVGA